MGVRILGIDPGTVSCGYAIIDVKEHQPKVKMADRHSVSEYVKVTERIWRIHSYINEFVFRAYMPDLVIIEEPLFGGGGGGKGHIASSRVANVVGALICACRISHYTKEAYAPPIEKIAPNTVKKYVTGNGRATKLEVRKHLKSSGHYVPAGPLDISDAIAVALCYEKFDSYFEFLAREHQEKYAE